MEQNPQRIGSSVISFGLAFCITILPEKNEEQMGQDGQLITTPPRLNGIGTIIWKNSGSIYMEFHFREEYG